MYIIYFLNLRQKESNVRQDYAGPLPTADKENVRQQLVQRQLNKVIKQPSKLESTTMNASVNSTTLSKRPKQKRSDISTHDSFVGTSRLYKGYTKTASSNMQTKVSLFK